MNEEKSSEEKPAVKVEAVDNFDDRYVLVKDGPGEDASKLEVPIDPTDNTISLTTLTHSFPGALNLKFKNPQTGTYRTLIIDSTASKVKPPFDGWANKTYEIIYARTPPPARSYRQTSKDYPKRKFYDYGERSKSGRSAGDFSKQKRLDFRDYDEDDDDIIFSPSQKRNKKTTITPIKEEEDDIAAKSKDFLVESSPEETESKSDAESVSGRSDTGLEKVPHFPAGDRHSKKRCSDLIVLGLPYDATQAQLREYFEKFGELRVCEIKTDHETGKSKGYGFVQYCEYAAEQKCLHAEEHKLLGRPLQVKYPKNSQKTSADSPSAESRCKLFIGRVPVNTTKEELRQYFQKEAERKRPKGEVLEAHIPQPFKGYGFVTLSNEAVCERIRKKKNLVMNGASILVKAASSMETRERQEKSKSSSKSGEGKRRAEAEPPYRTPRERMAYYESEVVRSDPYHQQQVTWPPGYYRAPAAGDYTPRYEHAQHAFSARHWPSQYSDFSPGSAPKFTNLDQGMQHLDIGNPRVAAGGTPPSLPVDMTAAFQAFLQSWQGPSGSASTTNSTSKNSTKKTSTKKDDD